MNNLNEINNIFNELEFSKINISNTNDSKWGDYQTNVAMIYFKKVKDQLSLKNPKEFGNYLIEKIKKSNNDNISNIEIAGPGFINITLSDNYLIKFIDKIIESNQPQFNIPKPKKIIVDYSSPNVAKEMHVGHLRSTIIGDVIGNFYDLLENEVIRINHIGDWGTQFGMLIAFIKHNQINLDESELNITDLHKWYKESKQYFDSDSSFNKKAHQDVVSLQKGNEEHLKIWKKICKISESSYQEVYRRLNISPNLKIYGESFYNKYLEDLVEDLDNKNLLKDDNGAKLLFVDKKNPPLIVKKSDGGFGYDATDLAALKYRIKELKADKIIYVTDSGQNLHFKLLFKAAKLAGWINDQDLNHVSFGVVLGEDGKRIKSRSGESIKLTDLLDEAKNIYIENNQKRKEDNTCRINSKSLENISKLIGWNAVKYADLKHNRNNDYQFDYQKMLDTKGDTLVYQLYSWVRLKNLFRKTEFDINQIKEFNIVFSKIDFEYKTERNLILHLTQFDEIIKKVSDTLLPNYLCEYIYQMSIKINEFWRDCKVLNNENEKSRLKICLASKITMKRCFDLLSIPIDQIERL